MQPSAAPKFDGARSWTPVCKTTFAFVKSEDRESFRCSVTLTVKKFRPLFKRNLFCPSSHPLPLVLSLGVTEKSPAPSS